MNAKVFGFLYLLGVTAYASFVWGHSSGYLDWSMQCEQPGLAASAIWGPR